MPGMTRLDIPVDIVHDTDSERDEMFLGRLISSQASRRVVIDISETIVEIVDVASELVIITIFVDVLYYNILFN